MDFNSLSENIEQNIKANEFYYNMYDKLQNKISFVILLYTFICFYIIEIIKYPFNIDNACEIKYYTLGLIIFILSLLVSVLYSYKLIVPETMLFINQPKVFYKELKDTYIERLPEIKADLLNEYIMHSYLGECEKILEHNSKLYIRKSSYFYKNFLALLFCIPLYVLISSYVIIHKKSDKNQIEISNINELLIPKKQNNCR